MKSKLRLTYERFLAYFGNKLTGKEKHAFEKSVMQDDFESDAFDGLSKLNAMEIQKDLDELNLTLQSKIKSKQKKRVVWLPYAASIIVILGLSIVLFYINQTPTVNEFVSQDIEQAKIKQEFENIPITMQDSSEVKPDVENEEVDELELLEADADEFEILNDEVESDEEIELLVVEELEEEIALEEIINVEEKQKTPIAKVLIEESEQQTEIVNDKVEQALSGKVAGISTTKSDSGIRIRGVSSISKNAPGAFKYIKGQVVDENKEPIPGVSIVVKGSTYGVTTDVDGKFKMNLVNTNKDYKLTASFVGFESKEIVATDSLLVILEQDSAGLNEVVVVGYGAKKKEFATGSVTEVEMDEPQKSWNNAQPVNSKNISEYKEKLISVLQTEFENELTGKYKLKISFKVLSSGTINDIKVKGSKSSALSEKVIDLIQHGEKWAPAESNDISIDSKVRFTLRLNFN